MFAFVPLNLLLLKNKRFSGEVEWYYTEQCSKLTLTLCSSITPAGLGNQMRCQGPNLGSLCVRLYKAMCKSVQGPIQAFLYNPSGSLVNNLPLTHINVVLGKIVHY